MTSLQQFAADHRYLREIVCRQAGLKDPVLVDAADFETALTEAATLLETLPIDGVSITSWRRKRRHVVDEVLLGMRTYEIESIKFAVVTYHFHHFIDRDMLCFLAVDRVDYERLRSIAQRIKQRAKQKPILAANQAQVLWENTIGYLDRSNLERIRRYGGRPHRGVLLTGSPGNGKTMACRWIWDECRERGFEWRLVTPDKYRRARCEGDIDGLFRMADRGVIFFDDMDQALRDRDQAGESEDQSVFLTALDGMQFKQGVVFVFTTNCPLERIDRAFKRPGRIDVALALKEPDAEMRRRLISAWHEDIRRHLDEHTLVASTDGYSFAELEEIKNLLVMSYLDRGVWDWTAAVEQFSANRHDLVNHRRPIGFCDAPACSK